MHKRNSIAIRGQWVVALAAVMMAAAPSWGQQNLRRTIHLRVKADRVPEFRAAMKDEAEALKKAGWKRTRTLWQSASGPSEYLMVQYYGKYADMEEATATSANAGVAAAFARVRSCLESTETVIEEGLPELSIPRTGEPPQF